ncbi:MAG: carbohydrate-binding domain-containing protein [Erysipelotrichaceae bacterium]|nr:carbohydrate-binding domain-containing protein [Erysipelotrichaceae bacterium]
MIRKSIIICLLIFIFTTLIACSKGLDHSINDNFTTIPTPIENTIDNNSFQPMINTSEMFTQRDLTNTVDKSQAISLSLKNNEDYLIDKEGIYLLSGDYTNTTIIVEVSDNEKVQLVLNGVNITNDDNACIYVENADKLFVTTISNSSLTVTNTFESSNDKIDAVIYSKDDLTLNGIATLTVNSSETAIKCNDDLTITSAEYIINAQKKGIDANNSIAIANGIFTINAKTDGLHAENNDDDSLGYIYIADGTFNINASDDGIYATSVLQIDSGDFTLKAYEAIESTYIQINGGQFNISAYDDGINAARKSSFYSPVIEINSGTIKIVIANGDHDAIDSNGDLIITGGIIDITSNSAFDYDGKCYYSGGSIIVNGQQVDSIPTNNFNGGKGGNSKPNH